VSDETVAERGARITAERGVRRLRDVLAGFGILADAETDGGRVVVSLDPRDVDVIADDVDELRYDRAVLNRIRHQS
jgi:hypothetical protein